MAHWKLRMIEGLFSLGLALMLVAVLLGCATTYDAAVASAESRYAAAINVCRVNSTLPCFDSALSRYEADLNRARTAVCNGDDHCIAYEKYRYERWVGNDRRKP